jgi:hypothetical protein
MVEAGLLSSTRDVSATMLAQWAKAKLGTTGLQALAPEERDLDWLQFLFRPGTQFSFPPLKHLLLATALQAKEGSAKWTLDYVSSGPSQRDTSSLDQASALKVREMTRLSIERRQRLGVTDCLQQLGLWGTYRHDRSRWPQLRAAVNALLRSKAAERRKRRHWHV